MIPDLPSQTVSTEAGFGRRCCGVRACARRVRLGHVREPKVRTRDEGATQLVGRAPAALQLAAPLLLREPALDRARRRARRDAPPLDAQRLAQRARRAARSRARGSAAGSARPARPPAATGPAFATTRCFCAGVSAVERSTSKRASTRVSDVFACCPPGPLEREVRSSISRQRHGDRAGDPNRLALHGRDSARRRRRPARLREGSARRGRRRPAAARRRPPPSLRHQLDHAHARGARRVAARARRRSSRTRSCRRRARAAAHALAGKRVLALTMAAIVERPRGRRARRRERGRRPDRRRRRGAGDGPRLLVHEPRARVRRARRRRGALLPAQEPLVADRARRDARLGRVRGRARVRGPDGGDRPRQAEHRVLRRRARGARRRARR